MQKVKLYPTISMGSRDDIVRMNIGQDIFHFNLQIKLDVKNIFVKTLLIEIL
jgi:hypothetical protein